MEVPISPLVPVPESVENKLVPILLSEPGYKPFKNVYKLENMGMEIPQALSLRRHLLRNRAMKRSGALKQYVSLARDYQKMGVLDLATRIEQPPMSILRLIVKAKYGKSIATIFKDPIILDSFDFTQFQHAQQHDVVEGIDPNKILEEADQYELDVQQWLEAQGITFWTQADLVKKGWKSTPDFFFPTPVTIQNKKINWIDAKNFYGTTKSFLYKKLQKQAKRYVNTFGSGAMVFSLGCSNKVVIADTVMCRLNRKEKNK